MAVDLTLTTKLSEIQSRLSAPKSQHNSFGNYSYRSCEDILEAVKPLLREFGLILTLSDEICTSADGGDVFIQATATLTDGDNEIVVTALAKHPDEQKGMNASQITGSTSSYARKYALNGLFCIDDNKDADTDEYKNQNDKAPAKEPAKTVSNPAKADGGTTPKPLPAVKF